MSYRCLGFILAVLAVGVLGSAQDAGKQSTYALSVVALKGPTVTDVTVTVTSDSMPPSAAKKIKIKALDSEGEAIWVQEFNDVALSGGSATFPFNELTRHQTIDVSVKLDGDGGTVNLDAQTQVQLRPDLTISPTSLPETVQVGTDVVLSADVSEINGDTAATCDVSLVINGRLAAVREGVAVAAGGSTPVSFTHRFCIPGSYSVQFAVSAVVPGEYDASNNAASFELSVGSTAPSGVLFLNYRGVTEFNVVELTSWTQFLRPARWPMSLSVDVCYDGEEAIHFERSGFNYAVRETASFPSTTTIIGIPDSTDCRHLTYERVEFRTEEGVLISVQSIRVIEHNGTLQFAATWVGVLFSGNMTPASERVDVTVNITDADGLTQGYSSVMLTPTSEPAGYAGLARGGHPEDVVPFLPQLPNFDGDLSTVPTPDPLAEPLPDPEFGECPPPDFEGHTFVMYPGISFTSSGGFEIPPGGGEGGEGGEGIPLPPPGEEPPPSDGP